MKHSFDYGSPSTPEDVQRLGEILDQSFGSSPDDGAYLNAIGQENLRLLRQSSHLSGGLALIPISCLAMNALQKPLFYCAVKRLTDSVSRQRRGAIAGFVAL